MSVVLIGFKSCGKTSTGMALAQATDLEFVDLDAVLEDLVEEKFGVRCSFREAYKRFGETTFRALESESLKSLAGRENIVLATGGGAPMTDSNRPLLKAVGKIVYLRARPDTIFARLQANGMPAYMQDDPTIEHLESLWTARDAVYEPLADVIIEVGHRTPENVAEQIAESLGL